MTLDEIPRPLGSHLSSQSLRTGPPMHPSQTRPLHSQPLQGSARLAWWAPLLSCFPPCLLCTDIGPKGTWSTSRGTSMAQLLRSLPPPPPPPPLATHRSGPQRNLIHLPGYLHGMTTLVVPAHRRSCQATPTAATWSPITVLPGPGEMPLMSRLNSIDLSMSAAYLHSAGSLLGLPAQSA